MLAERTAVPQPGIAHTLPSQDNAAGHTCDILRCHGHFSHTLFADCEAQPWQAYTGMGFASFLILKTSYLGFCFKTIFFSNSGGACREVGSR